MAITTITICGAGTMGHGIAQVCAQNGFEVRLYDIQEEYVQRGKNNIVKNLDKGIEKGKVTEASKRVCLDNLTCTTDLELACNNTDLVIEAIPEKLVLKHQLLKK